MNAMFRRTELVAVAVSNNVEHIRKCCPLYTKLILASLLSLFANLNGTTLSLAGSTETLRTSMENRDAREFIPDQEAGCSLSGLTGGGGSVITRHCYVEMKFANNGRRLFAEIITVYSDKGEPEKIAAFAGVVGAIPKEVRFQSVEWASTSSPQKTGPQGECRVLANDVPSRYNITAGYQKICFTQLKHSDLIAIHWARTTAKGEMQFIGVNRVDAYRNLPIHFQRVDVEKDFSPDFGARVQGFLKNGDR